MSKWFVVDGGESILTDSIIGVGALKKVRVSSGRGQGITERTVYNFTIRLGAWGVVIKSQDYDDLDMAHKVHRGLLGYE